MLLIAINCRLPLVLGAVIGSWSTVPVDLPAHRRLIACVPWPKKIAACPGRSLCPGGAAPLGGWLKRMGRSTHNAAWRSGRSRPTAHDEALYLMLRTLGLPLDSEPRGAREKVDGR
jgi:hypothetical protein